MLHRVEKNSITVLSPQYTANLGEFYILKNIVQHRINIFYYFWQDYL